MLLLSLSEGARMKLSELYAQVQAAGEDALSYSASLAAPDQDGTDVDLASVGRVELHPDQGEVRLYPASTSTDPDSVEVEPWLDEVMSQLPAHVRDQNDLRLMVEMPLLRDAAGDDPVTLVQLSAVHIGHQSREVWLLVRPASEYARGLLPA